ncbi:MAG: MBL fold metallo-hydrolase RNA specificity domain-containing protein [Christensenellales bacterium]|jgi:metallo-beta-lactamase family protein
MILRFFGAAQSVTGSCHCIEASGSTVLIDFGMLQGKDEKNGVMMPVDARDVDAVLLTHAHIDHSGRIPLLVKNGFTGRVICTRATAELCSIMLPDSGHIQEMETEWLNRKRSRAGKPPVEPLYTAEDARGSLKYFKAVDYGEIIDVCPSIKARFVDAGHMLGSASVEVWAEADGTSEKIVFSGDLGNTGKPIIKDPSYIEKADYVVVESTYGDRLHGGNGDSTKELAEIVERTFLRGGNVVIPSFAVGRTQELLYCMREIINNNLAPLAGNIPVFIDSPLAIRATEIFEKYVHDYYDEEAMEIIERGEKPLSFPSLNIIETADESRAMNFMDFPKVIISSSGMCEAGRIKHHLKHNLWRPESTVAFAGYQAMGTLGRSILDGAKKVKIFGEEIEVKAEISKLEGFSGHADRNGIIKWIKAFEGGIKRVFMVHGEQTALEELAKEVEKLGIKTSIPSMNSWFDTVSMQLNEIEQVMDETALQEVQYDFMKNAIERLGAIIRDGESTAAGMPPEQATEIRELAKRLRKIHKKYSER